MSSTRRRARAPAQEQDWLESLEDQLSTPSGADPQHFRKAVSMFATGIVVLTCEDGEGHVHGITVNSFTSVSLEPPTVLVSLRPGKGHRLISTRGCYGASILDETQQPFSAHFAGRPQASLGPEFVVRNRLPTLRRCLAWFECEVIEQVQVHDHTLFVAEVMACGNEDGSPLMFFGSRYHRSAFGS